MDNAAENHANGIHPSNEPDDTVCLASDSSNADGSVSVNAAVHKWRHTIMPSLRDVIYAIVS